MYSKPKYYDKTVIKFYFITFIIENEKKMSKVFQYFSEEEQEKSGLKQKIYKRQEKNKLLSFRSKKKR